ncbi:MAG: ABC transporter permease, partial [Acidobacteriaceae bacterium]
MENLAQDIRYTIRTLLRAPGFSVVVILSIALAFAANATVFSVANGLLWGVLPVRDPGRMVMFSEGDSFSYPDYIDYRDQTTAIFEGGIAAHFPLIPASIGGKGAPERVWGQSVSGNFFSMVEVPMALGRPLLPDDDTAARDHVVVLSNGLWRRRFGGDPNILNRDVALNGQHYTVVGVAPPGFYGVDRGIASEFWVPLAASGEIMPDLSSSGGSLRTARDNQWVMLDARLKPGVTRARALLLVNIVKKRLDDAWHKENKTHEKITLETAGALIAGSETPAFALMAVLMTVVGLVLLVACANVANLLLARATGRQREIAIRLAVGAGRRQLVRQLLIESFLLSLAGAGAGFLLAAVAAHAISRIQLPLPFPVAFDFNVDWRVGLFALGLSAITALAFGLIPALRASRPDLVGSLKDGPAGLGGSSRSRMRNTLVIVQVSLSLVLLTTAGLFLRSLGHASSIDIGFKPANLLVMSMDPKLQNYSHDKTVQF